MENEWEIGDGLAHWWTPNFETFMASLHIPRILTLLIITVPVYPCTHHKAEGMQRVVLGTYAWTKSLPSWIVTCVHATLRFSAVLAVPKNMKLLTIPLFELITRLGTSIISVLPRFASLSSYAHSGNRYDPQLSAIPNFYIPVRPRAEKGENRVYPRL
ncbi:hypothetical protein F5141DRAFT_581229 [Pisolithus sp. B1]|nr:hypothetical protein F5141DRAFT_581229 [Pisolithus sp. B1]